MKGKWTHALWARFLAFLLAVLAAAGLACSAVIVIWSLAENWYFDYEEPEFADSWLCQEAIYGDIHMVIGYLQSNDLEWAYEKYADSNFRFTIRKIDPATGRPSSALYADSCGQLPVDHVMEYYFDLHDMFDEETGLFHTQAYRLDAYLRAPIQSGDDYYALRVLYAQVYALRQEAVVLGVTLLILCIALYVFLLCAAGHKQGVEGPVLSWQDRIPLDLYLLMLGFLVFCVTFILVEFSYASSLYWIPLILACIVAYFILFLSFSMTMAARFKVGKWWRSAILYRLAAGCIRFCGRLIRNVSLTWRLALSYAAFCGVSFFLTLLIFWEGSNFAAFLLFLLGLAGLCLVSWIGLQMKALQEGGEALAKGKLDHRIDTAKLRYEFKTHGENLNRIHEGIGHAVEERMKSERFKTELITNVSHDIKTPLTSIINYIDLLKKEDLPGENAREYLEVLDRQSQKLKKLTEDVVEASKATAGVIAVHAAPLDAAELLSQSLAEYGERLSACRITPVVTTPDQGAQIYADGRLLWRVFDNLLQNICKYALSGTRAYFDVTENGTRVEITVKNISADALNISADALMERFVRGDAARGGEGSGLGLSIARSLTELQGGVFEIRLDGDLFKVVIAFPVYGTEMPEIPAESPEPPPAEKTPAVNQVAELLKRIRKKTIH